MKQRAIVYGVAVVLLAWLLVRCARPAGRAGEARPLTAVASRGPLVI